MTTPREFMEKIGRSLCYRIRPSLLASSDVEASKTALDGVDPVPIYDANLISSLTSTGLHRPLFDVDIPAVYVPSSTRDHGHLYFPTLRLEWEDYLELMNALVSAGIVHENYLGHTKRDRQATLRPPWVRKPGVKDVNPDLAVYDDLIPTPEPVF